MTTMIPFELPTLEEELAELARAGVLTVLVPASGATDAIEIRPACDPADTDAAASWLLRRMAEVAAERERYVAAWNREQELLRARYERFIDPLDERYAKLEALVCELASQADFGKKKSRAVGFGEYGRKQVPEKLEVRDEAEAIAFATKQVPDAVRAALKLPLAEAQLLFADREDVTLKPELVKKELNAYFKATGDTPAGCELIAAHDEPWCKVVLPAEGGE